MPLIDVKRLTPVHEDERRVLSEVTLDPVDLGEGRYLRTTLIEVRPDAVGDTVLGKHWHPDVEIFDIRKGVVELHTAPIDDLGNVTRQELVAGDRFVIPARVAHVVVCRKNTTLASTAFGPFTEDWIIGCELNI